MEKAKFNLTQYIQNIKISTHIDEGAIPGCHIARFTLTQAPTQSVMVLATL